MTDNRLRCALVYRLSAGGGGNNNGGSTSTAAFGDDVETGVGTGMSLTDMSGRPTLLAKYDHASQYETHSGAAADDGTLYGGRDKSYADACAMVIKGDPPAPRANTENNGSIGGFKVVQSDIHQVVYGADEDGLCLGVITGLKYPSRVAIQMLIELHGQFKEKFGLQVPSATVNSLSKKAQPMLKTACKKYDDLSTVDKTSALHDKVDEVKSSMQGNIASMLANSEKAEGLVEQSEQLSEQANQFKKRSGDLKKQMRCKNLKVTVILVSLVVIILIVIFVPLIQKMRGK